MRLRQVKICREKLQVVMVPIVEVSAFLPLLWLLLESLTSSRRDLWHFQYHFAFNLLLCSP